MCFLCYKEEEDLPIPPGQLGAGASRATRKCNSVMFMILGEKDIYEGFLKLAYIVECLGPTLLLCKRYTQCVVHACTHLVRRSDWL